MKLVTWPTVPVCNHSLLSGIPLWTPIKIILMIGTVFKISNSSWNSFSVEIYSPAIYFEQFIGPSHSSRQVCTTLDESRVFSQIQLIALTYVCNWECSWERALDAKFRASVHPSGIKLQLLWCCCRDVRFELACLFYPRFDVSRYDLVGGVTIANPRTWG